MWRLVFGLPLLLSGCVVEPDENAWPPGPLQVATHVQLLASEFDPRACKGERPDVFTADLAGTRVEVPLTHFNRVLAHRINRDLSTRQFNQNAAGPDGCPGAPFPAQRLEIKLDPNTPVDDKGTPSPLLLLSGNEQSKSAFHKGLKDFAERRADGRCRKPNANVTVCELTLNDAEFIWGRPFEGVLIFADNIPPLSTGDPFLIVCKPDMERCKIADWLGRDMVYTFDYMTKITTNRQAANLWVKLRPLAEYYRDGGGTSPPKIR